jgi:hypothetical protein
VVTIFYFTDYEHSSHLTLWKVVIVHMYTHIYGSWVIGLYSMVVVIESSQGRVHRQGQLKQFLTKLSSIRNYYNLSSRINYTEEVWSQNFTSNDKSKFAEAISLNSQNILFALKENVIHRHSKPEDPSTESNPHRFGPPTDNPHRHHRQEEIVPHLHTKNSKSKAWMTTFSKTYPRWPKEHL